MTYAIEQGERIAEAIPRIILERIAAATEQLSDEASAPEDRVHDARKRFKEIRAALRLIREPLGEHFEQENAWFRELGHELALLRDTDAIIEAVDALTDRAEGFHERRVIRSVRRRLHLARRQSRQLGTSPPIDEVVNQLPIAKARVTLWPPLPDLFSTIAPGLHRTYGDGRRAFHQAHENPSPERLHEWRKRVKDHWYHAQILRHADPSFMKPYREQLEQLSAALGDRHDLDVLRSRVAPTLDSRDEKVLAAILDRRSAELTGTALILGNAMYSDRPRVRLTQIESAWLGSDSAAEGVSETGT